MDVMAANFVNVKALGDVTTLLLFHTPKQLQKIELYQHVLYISRIEKYLFFIRFHNRTHAHIVFSSNIIDSFNMYVPFPNTAM